MEQIISLEQVLEAMGQRLTTLEASDPPTGDEPHPVEACRNLDCGICGPVLHQLAHEIEDAIITRLHEASEREGLSQEMDQVASVYNRTRHMIVEHVKDYDGSAPRIPDI